MQKRIPPPPHGWQFETFEVVPGLILSKKVIEPEGFDSLGVDAIVALEDWETTWSPPVPENRIYVHFPISDGDRVDAKTREVARLVAGLVQTGHRVLVHCVQGLNRSGMVIARALMFMGYGVDESIQLVRRSRGLDEGFGALGNQHLVAWLMSEDTNKPSSSS